MSNTYYMLEDMGIELHGSRDASEPAFMCADKLPIAKPVDFYKLKVPDVHKGSLAREIEAITRICDYYKGDVPVLPTIFSPANWVVHLYMDMNTYLRLGHSETEDTAANVFIYTETQRTDVGILHEAISDAVKTGAMIIPLHSIYTGHKSRPASLGL